MVRTLNLGILAHVDAGKTSLTERLLFAAGVIDEIGSVDDGSTQTDALALERQRGITIKSAVVSFVIDDVTVNLIDTPGHPDFIAEVERVLDVLDGAVLVVSAVEGVQAQTRVLMRTLRRLRIPTLIFVNKMDRGGARYGPVLQGIAEKLSPAVVPMGSVGGLGTRGAVFTPFTAGEPEGVSTLVEGLAEHDDGLLAAYLEDDTVSYRRLRVELAAQTKRALVHPVFFGSAITGAGVDALTAGIAELLPAEQGDVDGPLSGTVFKIERGGAGERIAYARLFSGTVNTRDRLTVRGDEEAKVTALEVFDRGSVVQRASVSAGHIASSGASALSRSTTRSVQRDRPRATRSPGRRSRPSWFPTARPTAVRSMSPSPSSPSRTRSSPSGRTRGDESCRCRSTARCRRRSSRRRWPTFGVDVSFRETTTICIERPVGTGAAVEIMEQDPNPFLATVGLRVDPARVDSGVAFRLEVELGSMPSAFFNAVEETVMQTLSQGGLHGWEVTDCTVTMTHSGYAPRQSHSRAVFDKSMSSTAGDFRSLTPLVLMSALRKAGTAVYEPMHRFGLELPADTLGPTLAVLARLRGVPDAPTMRGSSCLLEGEIPAARVHELTQQLPALTRGEGVLESAFDCYRPVRGSIPSRPRSS